jgi:glutathione S-transferase
MKLYGAAMSANARRVKIYLAEKGLRIDQIDYAPPYPEMKTPAFARMSPTGRIPVLELDDGTFVVESIAIMEYLEERFPDPDMIGATAEARLRTRSTSLVVSDMVLPIGTYVRHSGPGPGFLESRGLQRHPEVAAFFRPTVHRGLAALETLLGDNPFLGGARPMIPDCHAFAILHACVDKFGFELPETTPKLRAWYERFSERPSAPYGSEYGQAVTHVASRP